jgi:DUF1009 family protein
LNGAAAIASGPLAVIAGAGSLPAEIAAEAAGRGLAVVILSLRGVADAAFAGHPVETVDLLDPAGALAALRRVNARAVVLAGTVHRPRLGLVLAGWQAVRHREEIRLVVQGGDDNLLRGVVAFLEANGFPVLGVREVAPRLMAGEGVFTARPASAKEAADMAQGLDVLHTMGSLDIGQAVVVADRHVIAVEAAEGTDAMIRRVRALRRRGLVGRLLRHGRPPLGERGGVLVKAPKPGQDFRVDLPAIGPRTIRLAAAAGLTGIAVETGGVILVERVAVLAEAERHGLVLVGLPK